MSDRINALTVSLDKEMRDDDVEVVISAIKMIKFVNGVTSNVVDADSYFASRRVAKEVTDKLHNVIDDINKII